MSFEGFHDQNDLMMDVAFPALQTIGEDAIMPPFGIYGFKQEYMEGSSSPESIEEAWGGSFKLDTDFDEELSTSSASSPGSPDELHSPHSPHSSPHEIHSSPSSTHSGPEECELVGRKRRRTGTSQEATVATEQSLWRNAFEDQCSMLYNVQGAPVMVMLKVELSKPLDPWSEGAHVGVHYRRNQLCFLYKLIATDPSVRSGDGSLLMQVSGGLSPVARFEVTIEALDTDVADLDHLPPFKATRISLSQKNAVSRAFVDPKAINAKLGVMCGHERIYFNKSTANNGQTVRWVAGERLDCAKIQHFFRMLCTVWAVDASGARSACVMSLGPPIVVRGRNPGGYVGKSKGTTEEVAKKAGAQWSEADDGDALTTSARVGVGVKHPQEALAVAGNIQLTGTLLKPSDRRIKSEIADVDPRECLAAVRHMKVYDYVREDIESGEKLPERGVLAQEVEQVLPSAVHTQGDVALKSGATVEKLKVVDERTVWMSAMGATQALDLEVGELTHDVSEIDKRVTKMERHQEDKENEGSENGEEEADLGDWKTVASRRRILSRHSRCIAMTLAVVLVVAVMMEGVLFMVGPFGGGHHSKMGGGAEPELQAHYVVTSYGNQKHAFYHTPEGQLFDGKRCVRQKDVLESHTFWLTTSSTLSHSFSATSDLGARSHEEHARGVGDSDAEAAAAEEHHLSQYDRAPLVPFVYREPVAPSMLLESNSIPGLLTLSSSPVASAPAQFAAVSGDEDEDDHDARYCVELFSYAQHDVFPVSSVRCMPAEAGAANECEYLWDMGSCRQPPKEGDDLVVSPETSEVVEELCGKLYPVERQQLLQAKSTLVGWLPDSDGVFQFVIDLTTCVNANGVGISQRIDAFVYCEVLPFVNV